MKFIFLQNSATQPRCHKRFRNFTKAGIEGEVYSFNRNWYNVNLPTDIHIHSLGDLEPGSYWKRLKLYIKKLRPIFRNNRDAVFYCYGQDMAFVAMLFGQKYIYEESDIMYLEYKSVLMRWLMRRLDLLIQHRSIASVFTSQGFVYYLYQNAPESVFVLPNKLDKYFVGKERPANKSFDIDALRFAFIGLLRYPGTIFPFIEAMSKSNPRHEFHIWGDGGEGIKNQILALCKQNSQVQYHGPFRNPVDLADIYAQIDINFVCYDTAGRNERIAEPNKLYESTFFNAPILVSPKTYLAHVVEEKGTGYVLNCKDQTELTRFFDNIKEEVIKDKVMACEAIPSEDLIDGIEVYENISKYVKSKIG